MSELNQILKLFFYGFLVGIFLVGIAKDISSGVIISNPKYYVYLMGITAMGYLLKRDLVKPKK